MSEIKDQFLAIKKSENISYVNMYEKLFRYAMVFERTLDKDLVYFTKQEILSMFDSLRDTFKLVSASTYNSLIADYKNWANKNIDSNIDTAVCSVDDLQTIDFKNYTIINDNDIRMITEYTMGNTGSDYIPIIFIQLFWITDGQEEQKDILNLRIQDIDEENDVVGIFNSKQKEYHRYQIPSWLTDYIIEFSNLEKITFIGRNGQYPINTAYQNDGYIFRTSYNKNTQFKFEPISQNRLANVVYHYSRRYLDDDISAYDLRMSLALKHMVTYKKTAQEMWSEGRYFKNLPTAVYADIFNTYAQTKYPRQYREYIQYYKRLQEVFAN